MISFNLFEYKKIKIELDLKFFKLFLTFNMEYNGVKSLTNTNDKNFGNITTIVSESLPDAHGIITIVGYRFNEKNEKIQVIKKIKRTYKTVKVYKSVVDRQNNWVKFGKATEDNNWGCTTVSDVDIFMEDPRKCDNTEYKEVKPYTLKKDNFEDYDIDDSKEISETEKIKDIPKKTYTKPEYKEETLSKSDQECSVQILNIHGDVQEFDLYNLFKEYKIKRLFMPRDRYTFSTKGICFITFYNKSEAEDFVRKYNNYGLNYLIIKVSFV
jgi:hypothetical protein